MKAAVSSAAPADTVSAGKRVARSFRGADDANFVTLQLLKIPSGSRGGCYVPLQDVFTHL